MLWSVMLYHYIYFKLYSEEFLHYQTEEVLEYSTYITQLIINRSYVTRCIKLVKALRQMMGPVG